jgi:hypothetical protein
MKGLDVISAEEAIVRLARACPELREEVLRAGTNFALHNPPVARITSKSSPHDIW